MKLALCLLAIYGGVASAGLQASGAQAADLGATYSWETVPRGFRLPFWAHPFPYGYQSTVYLDHCKTGRRAIGSKRPNASGVEGEEGVGCM
jgi:hypothetical protein